ncbi:MAG: S-ribosylhomocysteine lyase [Prevotellaceae bacterium]|nr:S-ribosylhomocysteine lyase [Prevotellaceae bacterium]
MEVIPSFQVDHTDLKPGIYVSRQDAVGDTRITTYDVRMTAPNHEPAVNCAALHTIEHLVATFLRNNEQWKDSIIYWGPMGCLTGNYLIVKGSYPCEQIRDLMVEAFTFVKDFDGEVPGTTAATCGNYLMHDLPMAKWEANRYIGRLTNEFCCDYPGVARPLVGEKMTFFDA